MRANLGHGKSKKSSVKRPLKQKSERRFKNKCKTEKSVRRRNIKQSKSPETIRNFLSLNKKLDLEWPIKVLEKQLEKKRLKKWKKQ